MASMIRWLGAVALAVALLVADRAAVAAEASAPPVADPAAWGIYAQLVGTSWRGEGSGVEWQWGPDNTIVETRPMFLKAVISQGSRPGELLQVYGPGLHTYDGWIAADGSVLWIRRGRFMKVPQRIALVDGRYREQRVKLDDANQVVKVTGTGWYDQTGGAALAPIAKAGTVAATAAAAPAAIAAAPVRQTASSSPAVAATATVAPAAPAPAGPTPAAPVPALATPAQPAADPAQVARQHALNLRFWKALTGPPGAGQAAGRWWHDVDKTMYSVARSGEGGFADVIWTISADGKVVEQRGNARLDPATGTWSHDSDGRWATVERVAAVADGVFTIEELPPPDAPPVDAARPSYRAWLSPTGSALSVRIPGRADINYVWLPAADVIAMFEQAASARAAAFARQQAAQAEAQRVAVEQILEQQRRYAEMNAQQALLDAEADYEFEQERQEKAARWAQASGAAEQGLADSISRLNNTVSAVEAQQAQYRAQQDAMRAQQEAAARVADAQRAREATERQYEIARQYEAQRQAQAQQAAAAANAGRNANAGNGQLTVEAGARPAAPATGAAGTAGQANTGAAATRGNGPVMGFTGQTCAEARVGAQRWLGPGGTYEVASEGPGYGGSCLLQIRNWKSGGGTGSAQ